MTKEIAHTLGVKDDSSDSICLPEENYLMSNNITFQDAENLFQFSICSLENLKKSLLNSNLK